MKTNEIIAGLRKLSGQGSEYRRTVCRLAADKLEELTVGADAHIGPNQRWIPVTERLPEDDLPKDTTRLMIRCLVASDKGTVKPCVRQRWQHFDGSLVPWQWNKDLHAKPTHWMPLPEPPKEGKA